MRAASAAVVDAHAHVWDVARCGYPWLDGAPTALRRTFDAAALRTGRTGPPAAATVLVQADDDPRDTAVMLAVADADPTVAGVVVWAPLEHADATGARLDALADRRVVGVRTLQHDRPDPAWVVRRAGPGLAVLAARGVPYDYVTSDPAALAHVPQVLEAAPDLHLVLDHLGKPPLGGDPGALRAWRGLLVDAAAHPHVTAKLSGLYAAGADPAAWTPDDVRAVVDTALEVFGPYRLMVGSDWPVNRVAGGHHRVWTTLLDVLHGRLRDDDLAAVLHGTAGRVYGVHV